MDRCIICDGPSGDWSRKFCDKHYAEDKLAAQTGLSTDELPDSLPLEDFINEDGELDYEGLSAW